MEMAPDEVRPILTVYVVWHPDADPCGHLARAMFTGLCADPEMPARRGLGIPVWFRTSSSRDKIPSSIPFGTARHTVVFVLADDHLVADRQWRQYVDEVVGAAGPDDTVVPVAITATQNLPTQLTALQAIRLRGQPETLWATLLLNDALHDLSRRLDPGAAKVKVFLSHAKSDGSRITNAVRRHLHEVARLDDFFDAANIPDGARFADFIMQNAGSLPALLAVQTDSYASRDWCRLEVLEAKRLHVPIVVLSATKEGEARSFPYLGNVPAVRWRECRFTPWLAPYFGRCSAIDISRFGSRS